MKTILSSVSARPNFVKLASVHHALAARKGEFKHIIVHTGQHYNPLLSDVFFKQLGISNPDYNLGVKGGTDRESVIKETAAAMKPKLEKEKPDIVLVYGDVNGGVGAARAAKELGIKIGHVEAGLRSGDLTMPEEHNRIEIDQIADLLFVTEESGKKHLEDEIKEGKVTGKVFFVGNTMIDTLIRMMPFIEGAALPAGLPKHFGVVTLHRPSNVDRQDTFDFLMEFLQEVSKTCNLIFPVHYRVQKAWALLGKPTKGRLDLVPPLGYLEFLHLLKKSDFILTDSGGIQEEAVLLQKRCFTLRRNTERPSTEKSGSNIRIDPNNPSDRKIVLDFAENPVQPEVTIPEKWDGKAGERIVEELLKI
jgi:UDP-N-acetylglucosamine 2-epimerase (non-hydrolysing)